MGKARVFSVEFKVGVARRLVNGESSTALHREYGIKRSILYRWRDAYHKDGEAGLSRSRGRPPGAGTKLAAAAGLAEPGEAASSEVKQDTAAQRIAELEGELASREGELREMTLATLQLLRQKVAEEKLQVQSRRGLN